MKIAEKIKINKLKKKKRLNVARITERGEGISIHDTIDQ